MAVDCRHGRLHDDEPLAARAADRPGRRQRLNPVAPLHASLSLWTWSWDPTVLAGTVALGGGYAWLIRGRRTVTWSPLARLYFAAGLLALVPALESPVDVAGGNYLFSFHML